MSGSRDAGVTRLVLLLYNESPALLVAEIEFRHGGGFGRLLVGRFDRAYVLPALPDDRHAPASQLGGGGLLSLPASQSRIAGVGSKN